MAGLVVWFRFVWWFWLRCWLHVKEDLEGAKAKKRKIHGTPNLKKRDHDDDRSTTTATTNTKYDDDSNDNNTTTITTTGRRAESQQWFWFRKERERLTACLPSHCAHTHTLTHIIHALHTYIHNSTHTWV
ncbi:hypothetical protein B0T17DRAFT_106421 [Bombardia bombarda]|uniref:Secreted protein n=1 Tax=Bombardia bombarda TaxID=252184 RepID=A0AA39XQ39_9PEZI|nr:hypothetical protein B0T17DRAFT_106421 [Bombardia bombarda]